MGIATAVSTPVSSAEVGARTDSTASASIRVKSGGYRRRGGSARGSELSPAFSYAHRGVQLVGPPQDVVEAMSASVMVHTDPSFRKSGKPSKLKKRDDVGKRGKK